MKFNVKLILYSIVIGVIVNLVLPLILKPLATPDQIKPPNGAHNLNFFDQIMHMFVHHAQVPITSSLIIIIIILVSIILGSYLETYY